MAIDRRAVLKTLAAVPAVSLLSGVSGCCGGPYVNILLHGLFIMEFNQNKLVIATPRFDGHDFKMRRHGDTTPPEKLPDLPEFITLFGMVKEGTMKKFKPENLQFPVSDLGKDYAIDYQNPSKHRCTMVLPLPYDILALRLGDKSDFHPTKPGAIGDHILSTSSNSLATITCLQYEPAAGTQPFVLNYYAEHRTPSPTVDDINHALVAAQDVCGPKFTLQLDKPADKPTKPDSSLPVGVSQDDEEPLYPHQAVDVASCPQFGVTG